MRIHAKIVRNLFQRICMKNKFRVIDKPDPAKLDAVRRSTGSTRFVMNLAVRPILANFRGNEILGTLEIMVCSIKSILFDSQRDSVILAEGECLAPDVRSRLTIQKRFELILTETPVNNGYGVVTLAEAA